MAALGDQIRAAASALGGRPRGRGSGLRRPVRSLLRSLHRFSAFQVAGRRSVSLVFSAGRLDRRQHPDAPLQAAGTDARLTTSLRTWPPTVR